MELTAENTALVLDSTADYPEGPERFRNWRVVPLYVRFVAESFRDYEELGPGEFYERLRRATDLPTTSQPTPADFLRVYEELSGYERIISLHIPLKLSGTLQSARSAGEELGGGKVRAIDSGTVSAGLAMLALAVQRRLDRGTTDGEVDALVERFKTESGIVWTVDTLEFLARGGRIGKAAAMAGALLNIKPILGIEDGEVVPRKRVRGAQKAFLEFANTFQAATRDSSSLRVGIAHADAPDRLAALRELVARVRPQAQIEVETTLGAVVGTHAGPGAVGFFWFDDAG
ncbi:MAG TPA: DegV family protein [Gaiellaceae bacterium]|nr:DegV family protein [Gaiellaceae bacterium]